jgi:hypothetical protein
VVEENPIQLKHKPYERKVISAAVGRHAGEAGEQGTGSHEIGDELVARGFAEALLHVHTDILNLSIEGRVGASASKVSSIASSTAATKKPSPTAPFGKVAAHDAKAVKLASELNAMLARP